MFDYLFSSYYPSSSLNDEDAFWYLNVTSNENEKLEELKKQLSSKLHPGHDDDITLLRFLKARNFDLEKTATMYLDMVEWRTTEKIDYLLTNYTPPISNEKIMKLYPHYYHKTDKYGRPVYIEMIGQTDAYNLLEAISIEDLICYHIWSWELYQRTYLPACSKAFGKPIVTTTVIIDLNGLSMKNFTLSVQKLLNSFSKIDQDYYPEHLGAMIVINTPMIFRGIWMAIQPLLQERTRRKITILGTDYYSTLRQIIPDENLPTFFGGKSEVPDNFECVGPWISEVSK